MFIHWYTDQLVIHKHFTLDFKYGTEKHRFWWPRTGIRSLREKLVRKLFYWLLETQVHFTWAYFSLYTIYFELFKKKIIVYFPTQSIKTEKFYGELILISNSNPHPLPSLCMLHDHHQLSPYILSFFHRFSFPSCRTTLWRLSEDFFWESFWV